MERISTSYLEYLTDDFSIWQHSKGYDIDFRKGYALDDGARALIFVLNYGPRTLATIYYNFLRQSLNDNFINFYNQNKKTSGKRWSEDAIGQVYWALSLWKKNVSDTVDLNKLEKLIFNFQNPRGIAYSLIGASLVEPKIADSLFSQLLELYKVNSTAGWPWIEDALTYGNAIIPFSFFEYYKHSHQKEALECAIIMLDFLNKEMKVDNTPIAIGNKGWYAKNSIKAIFDQQPIDIAYQIITNLEAYELTKNKKYLQEAIIFFTWFWGNNLLGKPLIDVKNQRCLDGLRKRSISNNSGAESIICFLWAQEALWPYLESSKTIAPVYQNKTLKNFFGDVSINHGI